MRKFTPNIVIWNVTLYSKKDGFPLCNYYFLSYKRAKKFVEKHTDEWIKDFDVDYCLGGETLWLLDLKE